MMTSDQYSKTIQREPTTSTQSVPSVTQDSTADTPCKQTDVVDKPLSSQVPIPKTINSSEGTNAHIDHKAATTDSPSCDLDPRKTAAATDLKSKVQLQSEDFLLYNDDLDEDEEMSCDLDSSLEGKLLIDESMSDEESGTKDDEMLNRKTLPNSQPDKPTSSIPTAEKRLGQDLNRINGASEVQSSFHGQELRKNEVSRISSTNIEKKKAEVDECEQHNLNKKDTSYNGSLSVTTSDDSWSANTKISDKTEEFFANKDIDKTDFKEKNSKIDSGKTFNESDKTVLKETRTNSSDAINKTAEISPKEVLTKLDSKDLISEQKCAKEHSTQSIQKPSDEELNTSKTVPRTVSPDSTTYAGEESCRLSFVLIEDYFLCLSCSKLFKNECFFKQHVWRHFHISSMQLLCKTCLSNKDSSQCPAVKEIFTMLHNSCSKDVSSLHLELLLNTAPAKDKDAAVANQTVNNSNDLPKDFHVPPESRYSKPTTSPLKDQSQNVECLIFCILSQLFVCLKCNKRMDTTKLPQHIYDHIHALSLPKHSPCVNEKECNIMDKIIPPMMSSIDIDKEDFYILKISWKWTIQRDLRYRVQLVRHYPNNEASGDNHAVTASKQELQLVKSWNFHVPNITKTNSLVTANDNDIEIIESKQLTDDNVVVDSVPDEKEAPLLVVTKQGYKKITFVIRLGRYICKACRKIYANLDLLNSHIMWHFHSHEKICSLDHYDGLPLKWKQCPILSNIESCIRKLDKETKMLNVYWKTDMNGKTYFHMQIVLPKENPVIDLSNQESDDEYQPIPNQDGKNISKGDTVIVIDDNSIDANSNQTEKVSLFRKPRENEDDYQKQIKTNRLTEREIPKLEFTNSEIPKLEIPKSEFTNSKIPKLEIPESQFPDEKLVKKYSENLSVASVQNPCPNSEGGFYVCGFSDCRFSSIESERFFEHLKTSHCHEERFHCIHCHHCATSVELLMKHFDGHTNQTLFLLYQCAACEYATNMLLQFEKHLHSNHAKSNSFLCRYCKQGFSSIELLIQHLNKNLLKFIKCPSCDARDTYRRRMLRHIAACHPNTPRKIVVSSQIICKTISQNKLLSEETHAQDANAMLPTFKIGSDEQQEVNDASKRETVIKSNESASREAKPTNNYSPINHLNHLISNINSIPTQDVHCGLTYSQDDEVGTSSMKNVSSSMRNNSIIAGAMSRSTSAECNGDNGEMQVDISQKKPSILVELLSHVDEKVQEGNDILSKLYASVQRRDSSEARDVDKDKGSKVAKEDRMMENYKLHSEVKVMLTRTNWPNETNNINVSADQSLGSGKERNVFQLFGGMEKNANVHRSQSPGIEAPVLIAEGESVSDKNNSTFEDMNRDDVANTDSPCTEESSDEKIQAPSQLHEISLGGSLLDVHLQKCYAFSNQPSQSKQLSCIICHHISKTLYQMHLHLLCDHFKWPLWECQDCGLRVYSHSKITTHCWRIHRNQSPRIKSLQLPIIELDNNNEFVVVNTQEEFVGSLKAPLLTEAMKKKPVTASVPSKLKKNKSTNDITVPPTEDPQPLPKSSRKRSKSTSSDKSDTKKKKSSSSDVMLEDTSNVMEPASMALSASVVDKTDEQPPEKKSETSTDVDRKEKKCSMCGFTCSLKTEVLFLQHMILEHMKEYKHQISDREIRLVEESIMGNSLEGFSCPFCYYSTDQRVDCKIHIWRTHARLKLLKCTRCKFVTWFEHHLKDHVAKRHGNKEEGEPNKNNDTPGGSAGKSDTNQTLLTSLKALSTLKSIIQKRKKQATSLEPVKPSLCSSCENVTLLELRDQLKRQQLKLLNGNIKSEKIEDVAHKPLSNAKSSNSHSQAHKKDESKKKSNPSTDSAELSTKTKKLKTSSTSVPPSTSNKSDSKSSSSSKEKSSAKKTVPTELKGVLPKPPFPLEKKSVSKSSKKSTSSSKKESASGSKSTESKRTASSHLYVETKCSKTGKKLYKCPVCLVTKKSISDIEYHWKKYQNAIYRCSQCTFKRHQSDQVLQHIKREHQNKGNVRSFQLGDSQNEKSKAEK